LGQTFFGLTDEYMQNVYEEFFILKHHGGWSFMEAYNLPIKLREWFVKRLVRQKEEEADATKNASKGGRGKTTLGHGAPPPSMPNPTK